MRNEDDDNKALVRKLMAERIFINGKIEKMSTEIKKGVTVVLKAKFRKHYKDKYDAKTVDTSLPVKVAKYLPSKGRIFLEGWEEVHHKKGGAVPLSSFDVYSDRKAKIFDFYKPEPIVTKSIAQIQEADGKNLIAICVKDSKICTEQFPLDLFYDVIDVEKGKFFTITSTIIPGKHVIDYSPSTEEEIKRWVEVIDKV